MFWWRRSASICRSEPDEQEGAILDDQKAGFKHCRAQSKIIGPKVFDNRAQFIHLLQHGRPYAAKRFAFNCRAINAFTISWARSVCGPGSRTHRCSQPAKTSY